MDAPSKSWSIHTRPEIISKYEILERVGSGAYSDVYRARRLSDDLTVALKEVHDYQSACREINALQILRNSPNVVVLYEVFWREGEDALLVLEFLRTDLAALIRDAKKNGGIGVGELKRWMVQILCGVDVCQRNMIVHRDLKPCNLLISDDGVLKIADFGQARILLEPVENDPQPYEQNTFELANTSEDPEINPVTETSSQGEHGIQERQTTILNDSIRELIEIQAKDTVDEVDAESNIPDGDTSCLATCTISDVEDGPLKGSYSYDAEEDENVKRGPPLTSCVGTRWFKAPELLYGSIDYGLEIDLWSLGCIFAELLTLEPLFPGTSDINQLSRIFSVLGNLTEKVLLGCSNLPDYQTISFGEIENPTGLDACLPNRSPAEISLVKKLIHFEPASRITAKELLDDKYFFEEPLPVPISKLQVPLTRTGYDEDTPVCNDCTSAGSDNDFDDFGPLNVTKTSSGFSCNSLELKEQEGTVNY